MMRWVILSWSLVLFAVGCQCSSEPLTTEAELSAMQDRVEGFAEENLARSCARPVLTGEPVAGDGTQALRDFLLQKDFPTVCVDAIQMDAEPLPDLIVGGGGWLDSRDLGGLPNIAPDHDWLAKHNACIDTMRERVPAIVQHGTVCSPFAFGRERLSRNFNYLGLIEAGRLLGLDIAIAPTEKRVAALQRGLQLIQLGLDVSYGGTSFIEAMIQNAAAGYVISPFVFLLERDPEPLGEENLDAFQRQITLLLERTPDFRLTFTADMYTVASEFLSLDGVDWTPPGGLRDNQRMPFEEDPEMPGVGPRDLAVLATESTFRILDAIPEVCGRDHDLAACESAMSKALGAISDQQNAARAAVQKSQLGGLISGSESERKAAREFIVATLTAVAMPAFLRYRRDMDLQRASLAALRLQIAVRRHWEETGTCPDHATLTSGDFAKLLDIPGTGKLRLDPAAEGAHVRIPAVLVDPGGEDAQEVHQITTRCPVRPDPPPAQPDSVQEPAPPTEAPVTP